MPIALSELQVRAIDASIARTLVERHHYLHRKPPVSYAFGAVRVSDGEIFGVVTYGVPASRHLQKSLCPSDLQKVQELNRVWVHPDVQTNAVSWFVSKTLRKLPKGLLIASYADTAQGHTGAIYRAMNWHYAGWTDMDRKTPRFDYVVPSGRHTRDAFRKGEGYIRVRRLPKYKYWTVTGDRRAARSTKQASGWPCMPWHPITERGR